jgi:hypothetical protein
MSADRSRSEATGKKKSEEEIDVAADLRVFGRKSAATPIFPDVLLT